MKNNNNTFIVSYIFNDIAPVISLWIQSGCGQIALTLWSNRTGCAVWCLGDLTGDQNITFSLPIYITGLAKINPQVFTLHF